MNAVVLLGRTGAGFGAGAAGAGGGQTAGGFEMADDAFRAEFGERGGEVNG